MILYILLFAQQLHTGVNVRQVVIYVTDSHWKFTYKVDNKGNLRGDVHFTKVAKRPVETDYTVRDIIELRDKFPEVYTVAVKIAPDNS